MAPDEGRGQPGGFNRRMSDVTLDNLAAQVAERRAALDVPGVAVGVIVGDDEHVVTDGVTSVDHPLPVDADTLFHVGSTTKTVTATAVLRLVERGDLDLDAPVRTWLPDFRLADDDAARTVTLMHLLTHTAAFEGDVWSDPGPGDDALARYVEGFAALEQLAPPGTLWSYSNTAFSLAGRVLEVVTGQTFEAAVADLVTEPLGMTSSCFAADEAITRRTAVGHRTGPDGPQVVRPWGLPRAVAPAGGLASSVRDQLAYARFHLGDGRTPDGAPLLKPESMTFMRQPHARAGGGRAAAVGLAWLIQDGRDVALFAHGGSTNGQESSFVIVPERGVAVTVLTNADRGAALQAALTKAILRDLLGPASRPELVALPAPALAEFTGRFADRAEVVEVTATGQGLAVTFTPTDEMRRVFGPVPASPPMPLVVYEGDRVRITDGPYRGAHGEYLRDADGRVAFLRLGGRARPRVSRA